MEREGQGGGMMTPLQKKTRSKGFTLLELIIMIIILSILAATAIPYFLGLIDDARNVSARNLLSALRAANQLEYGKRVIDGRSVAYTMGDLLGRLTDVRVEHVNYSNHGMKMHVLIGGVSYWYTMSAPNSGMPSVTEWKHASW